MRSIIQKYERNFQNLPYRNELKRIALEAKMQSEEWKRRWLSLIKAIPYNLKLCLCICITLIKMQF
jgi:hypothetical protein